jgi:hypothetical protein
MEVNSMLRWQDGVRKESKGKRDSNVGESTGRKIGDGYWVEKRHALMHK